MFSNGLVKNHHLEIREWVFVGTFVGMEHDLLSCFLLVEHPQEKPGIVLHYWVRKEYPAGNSHILMSRHIYCRVHSCLYVYHFYLYGL